MDATLRDLLAANAEHAARVADRFDGLQEAQRPAAVTVSCSDSRVLGDHLWGNDEPGRLFTCTNIGNRVTQATAAGEAVSGDVLFPLVHTATELAIVVGHTGCGAIAATYDALDGDAAHPPGLAHCLERLRPGVEAGVEALPAGVDRTAALDRLVEYNVDRQVDRLVESDDVPDGVTAVGAVYDFRDVYSGPRGSVSVINVDGESDAETLREAHPDIASRVERVWSY